MAAATPDFDDELSFAELTFGDDTDFDESPARPTASHAAGESDEGYLSSAQTPRHAAMAVPRSAGQHRPVRGARSFGGEALSLSHSLLLSPQVASSPRIRSRPRARSRSRGDGPRREAPEGEDSRTVVVRGLGGGALQAALRKEARTRFREMVRSVVDHPDDDFAFVECKDRLAVLQVVAHFNGRPLGDDGVIVHAERCRKATPGQDPRDYERYGEKSEILVLKNLPFNATEVDLQDAIISATTCGAPLDFTARRNSAGTFSGMAFARYASACAAMAACKALDGLVIGGREIRVEFKRSDTAQRKRTGGGSPEKVPGWKRDRSPNEDKSQRDIEEKLHRFLARDDVTMDFPASLSSSLRKHVHTTAAVLGLHHTSEKLEAGQRFVRVRKSLGSGNLTMSPTSSPASSMEDRVLETSTPATIRNDLRDIRSAGGGGGGGGGGLYMYVAIAAVVLILILVFIVVRKKKSETPSLETAEKRAMGGVGFVNPLYDEASPKENPGYQEKDGEDMYDDIGEHDGGYLDVDANFNEKEEGFNEDGTGANDEDGYADLPMAEDQDSDDY